VAKEVWEKKLSSGELENVIQPKASTVNLESLDLNVTPQESGLYEVPPDAERPTIVWEANSDYCPFVDA
jgi:hypothetical protein